MITRVRIRWAPQELPTGAAIPGVNQFPFDPTEEPGYIWHCHLLEHEDNEMMRPLQPTFVANYPDWFIGVNYEAGDKVRFGSFNYESIMNHTSQVNLTPDQSPNLWRKIQSRDKWEVATFYSVGNVVTFDGKKYKCIQAHISQVAAPPSTNKNQWKAF
ncbi:MAG TPA: carbohydrate-binding protein, partial [Bacillota bacterium]|nr:carbohydrate-binding protein [Bacillota bacterium]